MDYKKKYEESLERGSRLWESGSITLEDYEYMFPEHKESEDEKIRKEIISFLKEGNPYYCPNSVRRQEWATWLEKQGKNEEINEASYRAGIKRVLDNPESYGLAKQGEQKTEINDNILLCFAFYQYDDDTLYLSSVFVEECNRKHGYGTKILKAAEEVAKTFGISKIRLKVERNTWMEEWYKKNGYGYLSPDGEYDWLEKQVEQTITDKVEPKFKVGDWIIGNTIYKVLCVIDDEYRLSLNIDDSIVCAKIKTIDKKFNLWTIQDAKKGDILQANKCTLIFDSLTKDIDGNTVISSWYNCDTHTFYGMGPSQPDLWVTEGVVPATKEQRDFLFQKMKEAGYTWDVEKKELKKIGQEEDIKLTDFESALFSAFSYAWQEYLSGKEVNVAKWAREHSTELLEVARKPNFCNHEVDFSGCSEEYRKAYYDGWNNCNQQHSQLESERTVWNEKCIADVFEKVGLAKFVREQGDDILMKALQNAMIELSKLAPQLKPAWKPTWSEEDENMLQKALSTIRYALSIPADKEDDPCFVGSSTIDWLKSLKERIKGE